MNSIAISRLFRPVVMKPSLPDGLQIHRVVVCFLLASLLWKFPMMPAFYRVYATLPLDDPFFPTVLRSPATLAMAYFLAVISLGMTLRARSAGILCVSSGFANLGLLLLCVHQGSYNDVTFLTCWWTSCWSVWLATRIAEPWETLRPKATFLAQAVISLVFLGGAIGKWTTGYWSGEVLYEIYFVDRDFWIFNLLRNQLTDESLRGLATWYSRCVIIVESSCGLLWLYPARPASLIAIAVLLWISLFSSISLLSVVFCLLGLAIVGLHAPSA